MYNYLEGVYIITYILMTLLIEIQRSLLRLREMIEKDLIHWGGVDGVNGLMEH